MEKDLDRRKPSVENRTMLDDRLPLVLARERLEARGRILRRGPLDPANVRETLRVIDRGLADLHGALGPEAASDEQAFLIRQSVLQAAFPVLLLYQQGEPRAAWSLFLGLWRQIAEAFGVRTPLSWFSELGEAPVPYFAAGIADTVEIQAALRVFQAALRENERASRMPELPGLPQRIHQLPLRLVTPAA
jgi:hypothetical protein